MRKPLLIYGAGGLGREILAMLKHLEGWEPRGFVDDGVTKGKLIAGVPVIGGLGEIVQSEDINLVIGVGNPLIRKEIAGKLPSFVNCPVIIHPRATILDETSVTIGAGTIITAGVVVTTDIRIGEHVLLNLNATIGHDTSIGSYSSVMPGVNLAGFVTLGECVMIGSGANVRNKVSIGEASVVGMGSVVLNDVSQGCVVAGVPAKHLR